MRPLIGLAVLATLALTGCAAAPAPTAPTSVAMAVPAAAPQAASAAAVSLRAVSAAADSPLAALDCDRDGHASWSEVVAGLLLNDRRVTAEEFAAADLSRDGKWSEGELSRFLNHRARSSWLLLKGCPSYADHKN